MTLTGWAQIALFSALVLALTRPLGLYLTRVVQGEIRFLRPVEHAIYTVCGINPRTEQSWQGYALAMLIFKAACFAALYALLRLQALLPLNPAAQPAVSPDLAYNTAISFLTNTNWQSYAGETTMGNLAQMAGLTVQNFLSAAAGIAIAVAVVRGFAQRSAKSLGNFWVDLTRITLYVLLPASIAVALFLVWQGVPQTLAATVHATTLQGAAQTLAIGPVASQEAIKMLGTNGGGFFNANSAHPFENPTALTNLVQMLCIFSLGAALTNMFGRMVGNTRPNGERQGWAIFAAMGLLFLLGTATLYHAEAQPNPALVAAGMSPTMGNMEGKELRFGIAASALFATVTTDASCGAVNAMHDSFTPLGGLVPMVNMMLGEIIFGGVGSGLYGFLLFALIAVFVAGLMVGRTPEYLGKKIEAREIKLTMLAILCLPLAILGFTAMAAILPAGTTALANAGPHGFSEALYAYTSAAANNGSAFAGLSANTPYWNITLGIAMLIGRFFVIIPALAIAGSLAAKTAAPASAGSFPTDTGLFAGLVIGVILIVGGLTFFPALALGPLVEHLAMHAGTLF
jgi:K+-transporting ATPase ATPase A chain